MRKITIALFVFAVMALSGCHKEINSHIDRLRGEIEQLEVLVADINSEILSLREIVSALENNDHISDITPVVKNGVTTAYTIKFTSGITITLKNGIDGQTPFISIQEGSTPGKYYWTIRMDDGAPTWMTDSYGLRVRVDGIVPRMKIEDGYWWVSFNEGVGWTKLFEATGEEGVPMFQSINCSDPYSITFTLADGRDMTLPTMLGINELKAKCEALNTDIEAYKAIVNGVDTTVFITSIAELSDGEKVTGYRFTLADGATFDITNGKDNDVDLFFAIQYDSETKKNCWMLKQGATGSYKWLMNGSEKISAQPTDGIPTIGVKDTLGVLYFTFKYGEGEAQWMLGSDGEKIQATGRAGFRFFTGYTLNENSVTLTFHDGKEITLPKIRQTIPSLYLGDAKKDRASAPYMVFDPATNLFDPGVEKDTVYSFIATVRDTVLLSTTQYNSFVEYNEVAKIELIATGLDGCVVTEVADAADGIHNFTATPYPVGSQTFYIYDIPFMVKFRTPLFVDDTQTSHIVVFLTWDNRTIMKTIEFKNITTP